MAAARTRRAISPSSFTRRSPSTTPSVATSSVSANHSEAKARWRAQLTWAASRPRRTSPRAASAMAFCWPARLPISILASNPAARSCSADWNW